MTVWHVKIDALFSVYIFRLFKPASFADCLGDELPFGWDVAYDPQVGTYYVNHVTSEMLAVSLAACFHWQQRLPFAFVIVCV